MRDQTFLNQVAVTAEVHTQSKNYLNHRERKKDIKITIYSIEL